MNEDLQKQLDVLLKEHDAHNQEISELRKTVESYRILAHTAENDLCLMREEVGCLEKVIHCN